MCKNTLEESRTPTRNNFESKFNLFSFQSIMIANAQGCWNISSDFIWPDNSVSAVLQRTNKYNYGCYSHKFKHRWNCLVTTYEKICCCFFEGGLVFIRTKVNWDSFLLKASCFFKWQLHEFPKGGREGEGKWCVAKYGDPYSEFVLCI